MQRKCNPTFPCESWKILLTVILGVVRDTIQYIFRCCNIFIRYLIMVIWPVQEESIFIRYPVMVSWLPLVHKSQFWLTHRGQVMYICLNKNICKNIFVRFQLKKYLGTLCLSLAVTDMEMASMSPPIMTLSEVHCDEWPWNSLCMH